MLAFYWLLGFAYDEEHDQGEHQSEHHPEDGVGALFLLVEIVTGKQPSDKFLERAQMVGMAILLGLFVLATYNDLTKFIF